LPTWVEVTALKAPLSQLSVSALAKFLAAIGE
jgi:hypothetical protein